MLCIQTLLVLWLQSPYDSYFGWYSRRIYFHARK
jgi:hypothetical protein